MGPEMPDEVEKQPQNQSFENMFGSEEIGILMILNLFLDVWNLLGMAGREVSGIFQLRGRHPRNNLKSPGIVKPVGAKPSLAIRPLKPAAHGSIA